METAGARRLRTQDIVTRPHWRVAEMFTDKTGESITAERAAAIHDNALRKLARQLGKSHRDMAQILRAAA